jgi:AcrR family transcriptional regulator
VLEVNAARPADPARRSSRARDAIHRAARELVCEQGYAKVTIEAIAARAGVGKQTIYRWWPSKWAVVLDVLIADNMTADGPSPLPDTGDLAADVRAVLLETVRYFTDDSNDNLLRAMTAEMQYDEELAASVLDALLRPQFDAIVAQVRAGSPTTPAGATADPEIVAEQLVGPVFHRWLLRRAPLDEAYVTRLVEHVLGPARPAAPRTRRRTSRG